MWNTIKLKMLRYNLRHADDGGYIELSNSQPHRLLPNTMAPSISIMSARSSNSSLQPSNGFTQRSVVIPMFSPTAGVMAAG